MKIGILTQRHILGFGVDLVVHKTAQFLTDFGHDITVLANVASEDFPRVNYTVIPIPVELHPAPKKEYYNSRLYQKLIASYQFDALIFHTLPFFYALPEFKNTPSMVIEYGTSDTLFFPLHTKIFFHVNEYLTYHNYYPHADIICPISRFLENKLPHSLQRKTEVIPLGADHYKDFRYSSRQITARRQELGISKDDTVLLYVGRLNYEKQPYKNTRQLLDIFREVKRIRPDLQLVMIGYGDENDRRFLKKKGAIPVINVPFNEMSLYYQMCDIYVTTTLWEGFDLPLLEAQYFGKPVVAYSIGAHPEVCSNNVTGFLVTSRLDFQKKILTLAQNKLIYKYLSSNARMFASQYTWEKTVRNYENQLFSITTSSPAVNRRNPSQKAPLISIIIPNYNAPPDMLQSCLQSITNQTYTNHELVLVDNNSSDKSYRDVCSRYPGKHLLIENEKNYGFSSAINRGIDNAQGEWLLLLNFDTFLDPYCLENFIKNLPPQYTSIAGYAPKMYLATEYRVIDSIGTGINSSAEAYNVGIGEIDVGQHDRQRQIFGCCFGGAFLQKKSFDYAGKLDESYGMYYEDVDWCLRANLLGFSFYTMPAAIIYHYHSASLRHLSYNWKYELIELNLLKTAYKNFSFKNFSRALIKRLRSYHRQKKEGHSVFLVNNYNIIKKFDQQLPVLHRQRNIIQERRVQSEEKPLHYSPPPVNFFDPRFYSCRYTPDNILHSLEEKMTTTSLNQTEFALWTILQEVQNGELSLHQAKEHFFSSFQHGVYQKILFNLIPEQEVIHNPLAFKSGHVIVQKHERFPRGQLDGISLWLLNHNRINAGTVLCEIWDEDSYTSQSMQFPETRQDIWLKVPFSYSTQGGPFTLRLSLPGNIHKENTPSFAISEKPLYPFTATSANNRSLSGNIIIKYHFNPQERM